MLDAIEVEVVRNALSAAAAEMDVTIWRTSRSTVVRELHDYSTAVFNAEGHGIALVATTASMTPPASLGGFQSFAAFARRRKGFLFGLVVVAVTILLAIVGPYVGLDEPTSALDVSIRAEILALLDDLRRKLNLAYRFISHDLAAVRRVCQRVAIMYLGCIVETGETDDLFARPMHPCSRALLSSALFPDPKRNLSRFLLRGEIPSPINLPSGCHLHQRCPWARPVCATQAPALDELLPRRLVSCFFAGGENHVQEKSSLVALN